MFGGCNDHVHIDIRRVNKLGSISMSFEEARILRTRAETFLKHAKQALEREEYDFACFSSEQAAQLFIKCAMLELVGEVPRLHRVRELLSLFGSSIPEVGMLISEFIKERRENLRALDDAYITSGYLPFPYTHEDAEVLVNLAEDVINITEKVLKECRR